MIFCLTKYQWFQYQMYLLLRQDLRQFGEMLQSCGRQNEFLAHQKYNIHIYTYIYIIIYIYIIPNVSFWVGYDISQREFQDADAFHAQRWLPTQHDSSAQCSRTVGGWSDSTNHNKPGALGAVKQRCFQPVPRALPPEKPCFAELIGSHNRFLGILSRMMYTLW